MSTRTATRAMGTAAALAALTFSLAGCVGAPTPDGTYYGAGGDNTFVEVSVDGEAVTYTTTRCADELVRANAGTLNDAQDLVTWDEDVIFTEPTATFAYANDTVTVGVDDGYTFDRMDDDEATAAFEEFCANR